MYGTKPRGHGWHKPGVSGQALLTLAGAGTGTVPAPAPGAATPSRGYLPVCKSGWLRAKERDPGCSFGPKTIPPATRSAFVVYWAPGPPPKPNPPSSRFRVASPQSRLAPSRLALSRLALLTSGTAHVWRCSRLALSRLALSGLALSRLALRRLDATPPPGAGQIITGQLPSGRPARCWTACRNLPRIRAMSTREIVTLRIPERGRPARITDQRLHRGVRSGACDGA